MFGPMQHSVKHLEKRQNYPQNWPISRPGHSRRTNRQQNPTRNLECQNIPGSISAQTNTRYPCSKPVISSCSTPTLKSFKIHQNLAPAASWTQCFEFPADLVRCSQQPRGVIFLLLNSRENTNRTIRGLQMNFHPQNHTQTQHYPNIRIFLCRTPASRGCNCILHPQYCTPSWTTRVWGKLIKLINTCDNVCAP